MTDYRKSYQEPAPIVRVNITGSTIEPTLFFRKSQGSGGSLLPRQSREHQLADPPFL